MNVFQRHRTVCSFGFALALAASAAQGHNDPHACSPSNSLLGRFELSTVDEPGTWWNLTRTGMEKAGIVGPAAQLATMQIWFGIGFNDLATAAAYLVEQVRPHDANGNNFICAYSLPGKRTGWGDPNFAYYLFGISDDRQSAP